ncbi:MAG: hypothetical protein WDN28_24525 [Chthoniobacter sp.]
MLTPEIRQCSRVEFGHSQIAKVRSRSLWPLCSSICHSLAEGRVSRTQKATVKSALFCPSSSVLPGISARPAAEVKRRYFRPEESASQE